MNEQALQELISVFLKINPQPTDPQFHALAYSVGVDHEALEAISYKMLGAEEGAPTEATAEAESQEQKVLEDKADPEQTSPDDLLLNDGAPAADTHDQEIQDSTYSDGAGPDDTGVGIESDKGMMYSDGQPPMMLAASDPIKTFYLEGYELGKAGKNYTSRGVPQNFKLAHNNGYWDAVRGRPNRYETKASAQLQAALRLKGE